MAADKPRLDRRALEYELGVLVRLEDETLRLLHNYVAPRDHPEMTDGAQRLRMEVEHHRGQAQRLLDKVTHSVDRALAVGESLPPARVVIGEYPSGLGQLRDLQHLLLHVAVTEDTWAVLAKAATMAGNEDLSTTGRQASAENRQHVRWLQQKIYYLAVWAMKR